MRKFLACRPGQTGYSPESDLNSVVWIQHKEQPTTTNLCFPTEQGRETDEIFSYSKDTESSQNIFQGKPELPGSYMNRS